MINIYRLIAYGLLGWAIDTAYRSILSGGYAPGTWIPYYSVAYPVGAFVALYVHTHFSHFRRWYTQFVMQATAATVVEYISGLLAIQFLGRRLWDYSASSLNLHGLVDAWHTFLWGIVCLILVHVIDPYLVRKLKRR